MTIVANVERFYVAGFAPKYWLLLGTPIAMLITLSGFVRWRYRATRCLTMSQFFEHRYGSSRLRVMAGGLCWFSGVVNMGVFPGVGTRFFINFCALPAEIAPGLPTFPLLMAALLGVSVFLTVSGGQIAVIVTDFAQGFACALVFLALCLHLATEYSWGEAGDALQAASRPGESLFDPYDIDAAASFNAFYYASTLFMLVYGTMSWQGDAGYNAAAVSPHASQMAAVIGRLRGQLQELTMALLPLGALILLQAGGPEATAVREPRRASPHSFTPSLTREPVPGGRGAACAVPRERDAQGAAARADRPPRGAAAGPAGSPGHGHARLLHLHS